jgi:hypothetical protein
VFSGLRHLALWGTFLSESLPLRFDDALISWRSFRFRGKSGDTVPRKHETGRTADADCTSF